MIAYRDTLNALAFAFTIFLIVYALQKGMDETELVVNVLYFTVLLLSQIENLREVISKS
ncbi:hypothetical protein J4417_00695 [Candidatus Woesearchaeota archaeon]|nr:hypothetical protein [Candidatus Woesearchaeota archaeon]